MLLTAGTSVLAQLTGAASTAAASVPNLALPPQTKSADFTVFPPTGATTGVATGPLTTSGALTGYPGTPLSSTQLGYTIIPGTNRYQPLANTALTLGGTPPGCGTYRNCLACAQASWYGCAWNPGNGQGPVGCSQTWTATYQCTGIASPTEILAPCSAYLDCASCTNQAGCVFTRAAGCIYSAGPSCLQDPANCINYPAQCPAAGASTYTLPAYNPSSLLQTSYTGISPIYGLTLPSTLSASTAAGLSPYIGTSTGVSTGLPLSYSTAPLSAQIPAYFLPTTPQPTTLSTAFPVSTGVATNVYTPQYTGYGTLLPTGTLGNLAGQYYLITSSVPQTTMVQQTTMVPQTSMVPQTTLVQQNSVQYVPVGAAPPSGATLLPGYNPATGATGAYPGTIPSTTYPLANYGLSPFGTRSASATGSATTGATSTTTGVQQQTYVGSTVQYPYSTVVGSQP